MGLFSDIISSIGNGVSDIFGGGDNNDQKKKQQQQPNMPAPALNSGSVRLPLQFQTGQQQQNNPLRPVNISPILGPPPGAGPVQPQQPSAPAQAPQIQTSNYQVAPEHQSLFGQLVHGAGSLVKGVAQPFVNTGEDVSNAIGNGEVGLAHTLGLGSNVKTENNQQQFGGINNSVGLKTEADTPKNFLLNGAQVAGTVLAPGVDSAAEAGAQAVLNPEATNTALQLARMGLHQASDDALNTGLKNAVINTGSKVAANSLIGGGFNAANGVENGENPGQVAKDFGIGTLVGGGLSGAAGVVPIIRGARAADDEAASATGEKVPVESGTKAPGEPTNAPAGDNNAPPEKAPNATETGVKPPAVPVETPAAPVATAPVAVPAAESAPVVPQAREVPDYTSPHKNGKASVPGNSAARYNTGDPNLDAIVNDSIIAHKGTSATASTRADALDQVGITSAQRAQIRNIATKNVNKDTGKISASGVKQIEEVIKTPKSGVGRIRPDGSVVDKVTPLQEVPKTEPATAAETPAAASGIEPQAIPTLEKTGNDLQDLHNITGVVRNLLENGRDYSGNTGKNALQRVLDLANSHLHSNDVVSSALNKRMAAALTDDEARNVRNAIETGSTKGLSDKEASVVKSIQENVEKPSNTTRTNLSKDYQQADNHFPQVRQTSVKDAVKGAARAKGLNGKINTFDDLLNRNSRFSEGSSLGTFTRGGKSVTGDASDLGLVAKKDGTFVDKAGKVYQYSRATSQDLENAGTKIQAPKDALTAYVRDTLNLKTRADAADYLIKNSDSLGLDDAPSPGKTETVTIPGSDGVDHTFHTDEKTAGEIKSSGIIGNLSKQTNLGTKAWNTLSSLVAQGTVVNPFAHGLNLATNAAIGAGERANGITGASTLLRSLKPLDEATELRMSDAGVHFPSYGKNVTNLLTKLTGGASKWNEQAVAAIDRQVRAGMFENLTKGGASDRDAADIINKWMGGRATYNTRTQGAQLGIFWNYFGRQVKNAGRLVQQAAQGHPGALINAAIAGGATYAADQGLKSATGNQSAYIHAPGVIGIANDALNTGEDLAKGQYKSAASPLLSHVNPLLSTAAEQALGVNEYGDKFNGTTNTRLANVLQTTPESNAFNDNGHSTAEKGLNTFGIYTPHIKGDMATDNPALSALNVKGAQNGSSVAFPKDFTGEQEENVANQLGNNYTTKSAAILGSQTQSQQQKFLQATTTLKKVGITDTADVQAFSKLSTGDQASYVKAATDLNKAGTSISSSTVQSQLVKNGNTQLAASLNKDIPSSLPPEDKGTLETYSTLGSQGQKDVWLQNNDNAYNYYTATIKQKQAQGALTTDDTDTGAAWGGSGGTLYVKAAVAQTDKQNNVPQSLVELYKNTTKTEYKDMTGSQKDALTTYAQQLNSNGVVDKFGLADGTSSSSSSSASSSTSAEAADRAAGLPYGTIAESFVKPTSDPGVKSVSARAFTEPKLTKYAPDSKPNPFVRSISVKAGVK